ncbi:hypothetical protein Tco_1139836, partial [Tanacetum coccineum]
MLPPFTYFTSQISEVEIFSSNLREKPSTGYAPFTYFTSQISEELSNGNLDRGIASAYPLVVVDPALGPIHAKWRGECPG